ncbi:MAG: exodeoxyribonuclease V subunit beta [Burkholderiaceae bacterium]
MKPELLDALSFPLAGSRLIEASAGTGKTFTIAALYLRLVLGHGGGAGFSRPLMPPEILVVTFTDAATQELRDRIRARLAEAAQAFLAEPESVKPKARGEDFLDDLRAEYPPEQWPACARRLRLAAEWMDEAAVSTIHGWCKRMLSEHAFASGSLFTQTLETDTTDLEAEVARDYWRIHFSTLEADGARAVRRWWSGPDALLKAIKPLLPHAAKLAATDLPATTLAEAQAEATAKLDALKVPWRNDVGWAEQLRALLQAAVDQKLVDGRKLQARYFTPWIDALRAWAEGDATIPLEDKSTGWTRLTPAGLKEAWKVGDPPAHPALDAMLTLKAELASLPEGKDRVMAHAARWFAERYATEQQTRAQMGFNELLTGLDRALSGPNGAELAQIIRSQFPVALIDEFQDTDALQYRIFDAVYGVASHSTDTALILIGDPKQAIYAFRGGDIYTYLAARHDTTGRHATLGTNYRSSHAMVAAVNHVFNQAETRSGGAFGITRDNQNALPFHPVAAHGREESWEDPQGGGKALTLWTLERNSLSAARTDLAAACASEVVRLLGAADAGFRQASGELLRVQAADIAILVNNGFEAELVRGELRQRGVRSVYLSDRDSVMQSAVAIDLARWLAACAEPDAERAVRAALATATLARPWAELDRLQADELAWEGEVLRFRQYREMWRRQGVLPMLRKLIHDFGVPARLRAAGDERRLTDLLHLAEWLQQASATVEGEHALLRHFAQARGDSGGEEDVRRVRLESDEGLVKVVTVHKSKGLEYPLVFLPFGIGRREIKETQVPVFWHDDEGQLEIALKKDGAAITRANQESLQEDLRKLYVALTRARHALWVGAPAGIGNNALNHLAGDAPAAFGRWAEESEHIAAVPLPEASAECWTPPAAPERARREPPLPTRRPRWWIASYSALHLAESQDAGLTASAAEEIYAESAAADATPGPTLLQPACADAGCGLHDFPRGAEAGSFLHALLEWAGRRGFAFEDEAARTDLNDFVARRCNLAGWPQWIAPLRRWLLEWSQAPLDLASLTPGYTPVAPAALASVQVEMEFWFGASQVDTRRLDALVCAHTLGGSPRAALEAETLNGMLKGFIDLVFEHEGRYYVADYKSNWLGQDASAYTPAALREAVLDHRYDLQYTIYLLALHRLLKQRLPDYDYDRHLGGAVYLFLRGQDAAGGGLHCERPPRALIESLDQLFAGASERAVEQVPA